MPRQIPTPRWQDPPLDEAALAVARTIRHALVELQPIAPRWAAWFDPLLPALEDGDRAALEAAAKRARAAFGARDSVLDVWSTAEALELRDQIDRLQRLLARRSAARE